MARQLLLMRHAKSAWDTDAPTDFERPLAKRGQKDAPRMGEWLRKAKMVPDCVISSPAARARETTMALCNQMGIKKKKIQWDSRVYGAGTDDLLEVLAEVPDKAKLILIIGHNPGLEYLLHYLTSTNTDPFDVLESGIIRTATVVQLEMPDDWKSLAPGAAKLLQSKSPRDLE